MKTLLLTILIIVLVVLIGTWPLSILAKMFEFISIAFKWLAECLDFFGWNGLI